MKKIAVLIYPYFSMQEISCLTDALTVFFDQSIEIFSTTKEIVRSEDSFQCIADKTLDEFIETDYSCIVLPGILNPLPAMFDAKLIAFLKTLKGTDILIAAISSAPMLLAKAGLLEHTRFTSGVWEELSLHLDFIPNPNIIHQPLVKDGNIITAIGFAFREFAAEVIRTLGIDDCKNGLFGGITREYTEKELTYYMGQNNFDEFMADYKGYMGL